MVIYLIWLKESKGLKKDKCYITFYYILIGAGISPMSLLPTNSNEHFPRNEDNTLIEMSLFSELIKDESIIDSMIRELRYERNQQISQEDRDRTTINLILEKMQQMKKP
jgi:hypothetical protein